MNLYEKIASIPARLIKNTLSVLGLVLMLLWVFVKELGNPINSMLFILLCFGLWYLHVNPDGVYPSFPF